MHRVKYLNFSVWNLKLHSVFHVLCFLVYLYPLLLALHPLTGIEQVIYRWKAAVNTELSRIDHFFIPATILKVFHLKFIQRSSWTSCCFHVELLWRIFVCTRAWTSLCTNSTFGLSSQPCLLPRVFLVSRVPCDVGVIFKRFLATKYSF